MGNLQDWAVHDPMDRSGLCPNGRAVRTSAGAGDGGSTLLRPATPGRRRFGDHQLPGGGEKSATLDGKCGSLHESSSSVSDPSDTDRVEPRRVDPKSGVVARAAPLLHDLPRGSVLTPCPPLPSGEGERSYRPVIANVWSESRSEERRVGKECRS